MDFRLQSQVFNCSWLRRLLAFVFVPLLVQEGEATRKLLKSRVCRVLTMPAGYITASKVPDSMSEMAVDLERFRNKCCCSA